MKILKIAILFVSILFVGQIKEEVSAASLDFSVTPILPANQAHKDNNYFDLEMKAGASQTLQVNLVNNSAKEVTVDVAVAPATTNSNGIVDYSPTDAELDKSLTHNMKDLVKVPSQLKLAPHEAKKVSVEVKMTDQPVKGIIAGGLAFKQKPAEDKKKANSGITLNNEYQYLVTLLMRQSVNEELAPKLKFQSLTPVQDSTIGSSQVKLGIQNPQPVFVNQMKVEAKITSKSDSSLTMDYVSSAMQMAPNTHFDLPIDLAKLSNRQKVIKGGDYHLELTAYSLENPKGKYKAKDGKSYDYQWTFAKDFIIKQAKLEALVVKDNIEVKKPISIWWFIVPGAVLVLAAGGFGYYYFKKKKANKAVGAENE